MQGHYEDCLDPADCWCKVRRYKKVFWIAGTVIAIQFALAFQFDILSLFADGWHTVSHLAAYCVALTAALCKKFKKRFKVYSRQTDKISSHMIIGLLIIAIAVIVYESLGRLFGEAHQVNAAVMIFGGLIGFLGNHLEHHILEKIPGEDRDKSDESMIWHVLSDKIVSGGVVIGGVLKLEYVSGLGLVNPLIIDPLISLGIAMYILWGTVQLIRKQNNDRHQKPS